MGPNNVTKVVVELTKSDIEQLCLEALDPSYQNGWVRFGFSCKAAEATFGGGAKLIVHVTEAKRS